MREISSVSVGVGGVTSEAADVVEIWAGSEDREAAAECPFTGFKDVPTGRLAYEVGPLYATGFGEREAVRKDRYWPQLGT